MGYDFHSLPYRLADRHLQRPQQVGIASAGVLLCHAFFVWREMRRAAKIDANQPAVVEALRKAGAKVQSLAAVGAGIPDLLVAFRHDMFLLEVKDGAKPPSERKLTDDQLRWHAAWSAPVHVVTSPDEALRAIGALHAVQE